MEPHDSQKTENLSTTLWAVPPFLNILFSQISLVQKSTPKPMSKKSVCLAVVCLPAGALS